MVLVHDCRQTVAEDGTAVYRLVCLEWLEGKRQVEFTLLQAVHQLLHRTVLDVQLHVRISVEEGDERLCHDVAEGVGNADVQFAGEHLLQVVHVVNACHGAVYRILSVRQEFLSSFCKINLMRVSLEEWQSNLLLQMRNLLREGALRDVELARCLREIERLGYLQEVFQLSYFHYFPFLRLSVSEIVDSLFPLQR